MPRTHGRVDGLEGPFFSSGAFQLRLMVLVSLSGHHIRPNSATDRAGVRADAGPRGWPQRMFSDTHTGPSRGVQSRSLSDPLEGAGAWIFQLCNIYTLSSTRLASSRKLDRLESK